MERSGKRKLSAEDTIREAVKSLCLLTVEDHSGKTGKTYEDERLNFAANLLRSLGRWRQKIEYLSRMQEMSALKDSFFCEYRVYEKRKNNWFELEEKKEKLCSAFDAATFAYRQLDEHDRMILRQVFLIGGKCPAFKQRRGLTSVGFHKLCKSALRRYAEKLQAPVE